MEEATTRENPMTNSNIIPSETTPPGEKLPGKTSQAITVNDQENNNKNENIQHTIMFEEVFIKEEPITEEEVVYPCSKLKVTEDSDGLNTGEDGEITNQDVVVGPANWQCEQSAVTIEKIKNEETHELYFEEATRSSEEMVTESADEVFNLQEHIEITVDEEDIKVNVDDLENVILDSRTLIHKKRRTYGKSKSLCSFKGCVAPRNSSPLIHYFGFPVHKPELCKQWIINCGMDVNEMTDKWLGTKVVCEKHFTKDSFENETKIKLIRDAVPNVLLPTEFKDVKVVKVPLKAYNFLKLVNLHQESSEKLPRISSNKIERFHTTQKVAPKKLKEMDDMKSVPNVCNLFEDGSITVELNSLNDFSHKDFEGMASQNSPDLCTNEEKNDKECVNDFPTLKVKPPVRTYKRTAPKRQRPITWGNEESRPVKVYDIDLLPPSCPSNPEMPPLESLRSLHNCLFCQLITCKIRQHILQDHSNEELIKNLQGLNNDLIRKELIRLRRVGDFQHNTQVLQKNSGLLIVWGNKFHDISTVDKDKFLPCPDCAVFVPANRLKYHHKLCLFSDKSRVTPIERNLVAESQAMLPHAQKSKSLHLKHIMGQRLRSLFGSVAKHDKLIVLFAQFLFSCTVITDVSSILLLMKRMGFLLHLYRRISGMPTIPLYQALKPECMNNVMKTLQSFLLSANKNEKVGLYESFYSHIAFCAFIWRGICLVNGQLELANKALAFYHCFRDDYEKTLKNACLIPQKIVLEREKSITIPASDIVRFKNSLNERIVMLTKDLQLISDTSLEFVKSLWRDLAETTMCLILLMNPVEFTIIERMTLSDYAVRPDSAIDDLSTYKMLLPPFCRFSEKRTFVSTMYHDSEVIIVLTSHTKKAIDTIIKKRKDVGISRTQPFIFSGNLSGTISALNTFYSICVKQSKIFPANIIGNLKLRRYISQIIHLSDMTVCELELVKKYLSSSNVETTLQLSPEAFYVSDINKELLDTLQTYENSQCNNGADRCEGGTTQVSKEVGQSSTNSITEENNDKGPTWTDLEKRFLKAYFKEEIRTTEIPSLEKCQQCLKSTGSIFVYGRNWKDIQMFVVSQILHKVDDC